jgi:long-chain acyl-CoA synthetase
VNAELEQHERLKFVAVVKDRWTIESGFLTPTLKIRRAAIEEAYTPMIANWYESGEKVIWQG